MTAAGRSVVISGAAKGAQGTILEVQPAKSRVIVEGVRMIKKAIKPTQENQAGGFAEKEAPIHISNLMLVDPKTGEPTRVGRKEADGKLVRYSKKSGEIIK